MFARQRQAAERPRPVSGQERQASSGIRPVSLRVFPRNVLAGFVRPVAQQRAKRDALLFGDFVNPSRHGSPSTQLSYSGREPETYNAPAQTRPL
jgi:hypothetical protein